MFIVHTFNTGFWLFSRLFSIMPRKFRRVLCKGYSVRKPVKTEPHGSSESSEDEAHNVATAVQTTCEVATQTGMSAFTTREIFTQTEASIFHLAEVATQTESSNKSSNTIYSMTDSAIHTGNQMSPVSLALLYTFM